MRYIIRMISIWLLSITILAGCNNRTDITADDMAKATIAPGAQAAGENGSVTEAGGEISDTDAQENTDPAGTVNTAGGADPDYDPEFTQVYEAEEAAFTGNMKEESIKQGFTGTGYLTGMQEDGDTVTFTITVPGEGAYDFNFISAGNTGHKENNVLVDGANVGMAIVDSNDFTDSVLKRVYLTAGEHQVMMTKSWGWIFLDSLVITASEPADRTIYEVSAGLVDPDASDRAKRLMKYLTDVYGDYIISGQYGDMGILGAEFNLIKEQTGKYPAMLGLDFIEYTPSRAANGSKSFDVEYALKFDQEGGIVTFCWHWNAPEKYLVNSGDKPWWRGFYTDSTTISLKKIMDGEDTEGYDLLIRDMDAIAEQLKILQAADIPILWRPLHEASGGWFWWGASGPEAYIRLYRLLYDRLVNYHGIHNLIWVWNGQAKDWYPGDEYADIVGFDNYPGERVYSAQANRFNDLIEWLGDTRKLVAMTENGPLFDPEPAYRDNAMWSYFGTWEQEFALTEQYTEFDMLKKVYNSHKVITLDELPELKTYGD